MNLTYETHIVNERYDATAVQEANIKFDKIKITIDEMFGAARIRVVWGGHLFVTTKFQHLMLSALDVIDTYTTKGRNGLYDDMLWSKLPLKLNRALCMLRGHAMFYWDDGDAESGPGEVRERCLRCDGSVEHEYHMYTGEWSHLITYSDDSLES